MDYRLEQIRPEFLRLGPRGMEPTGDAAKALQALRLIERIELGPARERREYQQHCIAGVLAHARRFSRFWAARIPAGRSVLRGLPVLSRAQLRAQVEAEGSLPVPPEHDGVIESATTGSTGEPLRFFVSALNGFYNMARYCFDDHQNRRDLAHPVTSVTRRVSSFGTADRWQSLTGTIWRTGPAQFAPLLDATVEQILALLQDNPPGYLMLGPSALAGLLDLVEAGARAPSGLVAVLSVNETLPPNLRERTRRLLGAPIQDRYSCEELGPLALQCPAREDHLHLCSSNLVAEAVDDRGRELPEGRLGHLLFTALNGVATPMIRYDLGDMGRLLSRCPCGHEGPTLTDLRGRRRSLLRLPDGRRVYLALLPGPLLSAAPVRQWRVTQLSRTELEMEVVLPEPITTEQRDGLAAVVDGLTGGVFTISIRQVPVVDWGRGGKRHQVVNLLEDAVPGQ